jgi:dienelactone hydrolase
MAERGVTAGARTVTIRADAVVLEGDLQLPPGASAMVLFAHGSGSSRHSPRNRYVAGELQRAGLGTLLMDLLTRQEEIEEERTGHLRFDVGLLARRLEAATDWLLQDADTGALPLGYFGASTGAAAALAAAAQRPAVRAVVSRGGRPDLAGPALPRVRAATLLVVGGEDAPVIALNRQAYELLRTEKRLVIVPGASHLFSERGTLEAVAALASEWFEQHLGGAKGGR